MSCHMVPCAAERRTYMGAYNMFLLFLIYKALWEKNSSDEVRSTHSWGEGIPQGTHTKGTVLKFWSKPSWNPYSPCGLLSATPRKLWVAADSFFTYGSWKIQSFLSCSSLFFFSSFPSSPLLILFSTSSCHSYLHPTPTLHSHAVLGRLGTLR